MDRTTSNGGLRQTSVRLVAVIAVAVAVVALIVVIGGSLGSSDDGDRAERREQREQRQQQRDGGDDSGEDVYVVQPNDTLAGIAEQTGVPVDRLQELNPDIDPQALPSGAQLKLR